MRLAGLEVEEDSENQLVSTKTVLGPWTFPVAVVMTDDAGHLMIALMLSSAESEQQIPTDKLLGMLQANRKYAPASFGYSAARQRTELYYTVKNENITGQMLAEQIRRLANVADATQDLWQIGSKQQSTTAPTPSSATSGTSAPAATEPAEPNSASTSMEGTWVASQSDQEAFAIAFRRDGTFVLVYVKNGQQTKSTGKFTLSDSLLQLEGSGGLQLSGTISNRNTSQFSLQLNGGASLTFKRAS